MMFSTVTLRPWKFKWPTASNAAFTPYSSHREADGSQFRIRLVQTNEPTMATSRVCVLFVVLYTTLAEDVKLKYKPSTTPVRLFTEEELKRYDGREVNFIPDPIILGVFLCRGLHGCTQSTNAKEITIYSPFFFPRCPRPLPVLGGTAYLHGSKRSCVWCHQGKR